jgi:flagellar biosynthesis/type III secretory pathway M-ring protein FliF/YscJ
MEINNKLLYMVIGLAVISLIGFVVVWLRQSKTNKIFETAIKEGKIKIEVQNPSKT